MVRRVPFRIDRNRPQSLVGQMTDGLRDAIVTGYYKSGDTLPTIHEWTRALDVSIRVPEGALANLVKEGYVVTRPRHGCMVQPRDGRRVWRGHVLLVRPVDISCHFVSEEIFAAEEKLSRAGYLATIVVVRRNGETSFDLGPLEQELSRNVNLAVVFGNQPQILKCLAGAKASFMYMDVGKVRKSEDGCVGRIGVSMGGALDEFVAHCVRSGVRKVAVVDKVRGESSVTQRLEKMGIATSRIAVDSALGPLHIEDLERNTQQALDCLFEREGKKWLPDVIYVEDDYQAIGALFSLMSHGVKIPDDVRFATVKNYGHGPALPISLTCVEFNPAEAGASVAQAALDFLGGKGFSHDSTSGFRYVIGDTFPETKSTTTKQGK